jgi:hypothetical protein
MAKKTKKSEMVVIDFKVDTSKLIAVNKLLKEIEERFARVKKLIEQC